MAMTYLYRSYFATMIILKRHYINIEIKTIFRTVVPENRNIYESSKFCNIVVLYKIRKTVLDLAGWYNKGVHKLTFARSVDRLHQRILHA